MELCRREANPESLAHDVKGAHAHGRIRGNEPGFAATRIQIRRLNDLLCNDASYRPRKRSPRDMSATRGSRWVEIGRWVLSVGRFAAATNYPFMRRRVCFPAPSAVVAAQNLDPPSRISRLPGLRVWQPTWLSFLLKAARDVLERDSVFSSVS